MTKTPKGLGASGRRLWRAILAEVAGGMELDGRGVELPTRACTSADHVEALEKAIAKDSVTVAGSRGQTVVHPALAECRAQKLTILRLLKGIDLSADADESPVARRARRAATARHTRRADVRHLRSAGQ